MVIGGGEGEGVDPNPGKKSTFLLNFGNVSGTWSFFQGQGGMHPNHKMLENFFVQITSL